MATTAPPPPSPPSPAQRPVQSAPPSAHVAPVAPVSAAPAPPVLLGIPRGPSLVTWDGCYRTPEEVFASHEHQVAMVYVFDLGSETWLRWSPALAPALCTLAELRTGVNYWVIANEEVWVPMN